MSLLDSEEDLVLDTSIEDKYILKNWLGDVDIEADPNGIFFIKNKRICPPRFIKDVNYMNKIVTEIPDFQKPLSIQNIYVTYGADNQKLIKPRQKTNIEEVFDFRILLPSYETAAHRLSKISNYKINELVDLKDIHINKIRNLTIEFPLTVTRSVSLLKANFSNITNSLPSFDKLIRCYIDIVDTPYTISRFTIFNILENLKGINCNNLQIYIDSNINKQDFEKNVRPYLVNFFNNNTVDELRIMLGNCRYTYTHLYYIK